MGEWWEPEISSIEERVEELLHEIVAGLPEGCATLTVHDCRAEEDPGQVESGGLVFQLDPSNKRAAQIRLHAKNGYPNVDFTLGQITPHEVYPWRRRSVIDQIREVCEAVIAGPFEEKLWFVGSKIAKCHATITIGGKRRRLSYSRGVDWFRRKTFKHIVYEPYAANESVEATSVKEPN